MVRKSDLARYSYCSQTHKKLLSMKAGAIQGLEANVADLIVRESDGDAGDAMSVQNIRKKGWTAISGDEYMDRFHHGDAGIDILVGVSEAGTRRILVVDCKLRMKGGASITNPKYLPDVCEDIRNKYNSAQKNINGIVPITEMYVVFNDSVAPQAERYLSRCSKGRGNPKCQFLKCFCFHCLKVSDFLQLRDEG